MKREEVLNGTTTEVQTKCGKMYITLNNDEMGFLAEVFFRLGNSGTCAKAWTQFTSEYLTNRLRTRKNIESRIAELNRIIKDTNGIDCIGATYGVSCQQAIADILDNYIKNEGSICRTS